MVYKCIYVAIYLLKESHSFFAVEIVFLKQVTSQLTSGILDTQSLGLYIYTTDKIDILVVYIKTVSVTNPDCYCLLKGATVVMYRLFNATHMVSRDLYKQVELPAVATVCDCI